MGEYFPAEIEIGGLLPGHAVHELLAAAQEDVAELDWGAEPLDLGRLIALGEQGEPIRLTNSRASFGLLDALEGFCQEHGLCYRRHSDAYDEFEAETVYWAPGMPEPARLASDQQGNAYVSEQQLREFAGAGRSLADVITWLRTSRGPDKLPPFRIVGPVVDPDAEPDDGDCAESD